jgi:ATP-dependent RNA helicase DeaD
MRFTKLQIRRERVPSMDEVEEARENVFFERLRSLLESGRYRRSDQMIDRLLEQGYAPTDIASALIHLLQGGEDIEPQLGEGERDGEPVEQRPKPQERAPEPQERPAPRRDPAPEVRREEPRHYESSDRGAHVPEKPPFWQAATKGRRKPDEREEGSDRPRADRHQRGGRTGRERGMVTLAFSVGADAEIRPGDLVGKIAGVTRLPATVVGAIDIERDHSLVDVASDHAELILQKLNGVRIKGHSLRVVPAN